MPSAPFRDERSRVSLGSVVRTGLAVLVIAVGSVIAVWSCSRREDRDLFRDDLAEEFFERYVDPDGRVVRWDQGSDTVSEGQSYAMLLAVASSDQDRFGRVWSWTKEHLRRPDGLLASHWASGRIVDDQPAADADVDAAQALILAGARFERDDYTSEGRKIAGSIIDAETVMAGGERVLVAGPWARSRMIVNPSYMSPDAFLSLARSTNDDRWRQVARSGVEMVRSLTSGGRVAPPDWARVENGRVQPIGHPDDPGAEPRYGFDAPRVILRFAASCDERARKLATDLAKAVSAETDEAGHPFQVVAAAAAAHAAGDPAERDRLLDRSVSLAREDPTYYGWAWVALGPAFLDGSFDRCGV